MFPGKKHPDLSVQLNPYSALTSRVLHGQDTPLPALTAAPLSEGEEEKFT